MAPEHATGTRLHARAVAAAAGISQRRAYELTGRAPLTDGERAMLGTIQDRLPVLG